MMRVTSEIQEYYDKLNSEPGVRIELEENLRKFHFSSLQSQADFSQGYKSLKLGKLSSLDGGGAERHNKHQWTYGVSYEDSLRMVRQGWPEGTARFLSLLKHFEDLHRPKTPQQTFDFTESGGSGVDIARYLENEPACFVKYIPPEVPTKILHLGVNIGWAHFVPAESIINFGVAVAAMIDRLESVGYRIECDIYSLITSSKPIGYGRELFCLTTTQIKAPDQQIEGDRFAYAICHPAIWRRQIFAVYERMLIRDREELRITALGGYGHLRDMYNLPQQLSDYDLVTSNDLLHRNLGRDVIPIEVIVKHLRELLTDKGYLTSEGEDHE